MPTKSQSDVAYGFIGIRRSDPSYMAASVMNNALGQYALGGRLGDSIRERQGMAYYVFSSLDAGIGPGAVMVRAGVSAENVARTIASIDEEIAAVRADGFTEKEIAESKQYLVGALPRQLETNGGIASFLLNAEMFDLGLDYDRRLPDIIRAVTRDAAVETARRLLDPDRATVVVAGPEAEQP
jgi:zinc protease